MTTPNQAIEAQVRLLGQTLWSQLSHREFRWDPVMARDMLRRLPSDTGSPPGNALIDIIRGQLQGCLSSNGAPGPDAMQRLRVLLEQLRSVGGVSGGVDESPDEARIDDVVVIGPDASQVLIPRLVDAGLQVRYMPSFADGRRAMARQRAGVLIVHIEGEGDGRPGLDLIPNLPEQHPPLVFITRRDDLDTRLAAVRVGGQALFTRPLDVQALIAKVSSLLMERSGEERVGRLLCIGDGQPRWGRLKAGLETAGWSVHRTRPAVMLDELARFRPELICLDLDGCDGVDGLELAAVLRQHHLGYALPILLECASKDGLPYVQRLGRQGDDLFTDATPDAQVRWLLARRLQRARAVNQRLSTLVNVDPVSGLENRRRFVERLESMLTQRPIAGAEAGGLMLIMLSNWRQLRETHDALALDAILRRLGRRLRECIVGDAPLGRTADAQFATWVGHRDAASLREKALRLRQQLLAQPLRVGDDVVALEICIGVGVVPAGETDVQNALQVADLALSMAREHDQEHVHVYQPGARPEVEAAHSAALSERIAEAVKAQRMRLVYQPVVSLRGQGGRRYEALLRVFDSDHQPLPVDYVFGMAKNNPRLAQALDRWVVGHGVRALMGPGLEDVSLFLQVSAATLEAGSLAAWLVERTLERPLFGHRLVFQVSELAARQSPEATAAFFAACTEQEWGTCLIRFGRLRDSVSFAAELQPSYVKLDPTVTNELGNGRAAQTKVELGEMIANLGYRGIKPIVPAVEDLHVLPSLWSCGADLVQGYVLQRPQETMDFDFSGLTF